MPQNIVQKLLKKKKNSNVNILKKSYNIWFTIRLTNKKKAII